MKALKIQILVIILCLSLLLSGCSFLSIFDDFKNDDDNTGDGAIKTFDLLTDEKMVLDTTSEDPYCVLKLYSGEKYQIKTSVDDQLGEDYYLTYTSKEQPDGKFTISNTGEIQVNANITKNEVFIINVDLYKKGVEKRIERKYFFLSVIEGEYANIVITNDNLTYDADTSTYLLTLESGNSYQISYSVTSNVSYVVNFELVNLDDEQFMSVNSKGVISTTKTNTDKTGKIRIEIIGASGTITTVFLQVTVTNGAEVTDGLKVTNQSNAQVVNDGDTLTMYQNAEVAFDVTYNGQPVEPTITVDSTTILQKVNNATALKSLGIGTSQVTFAYDNEHVTITVNVIKDSLVSLTATNGGGDFIIINGVLQYLENLYANYQSGAKVELLDTASITTTITDYDDVYKTVVLSYAEQGDEVSVTYAVKFYQTVDYNGQSTSYTSNDFFQHKTNATYVLPNEGTIKLLVIPVWFSDSNVFFLESQQQQLIEDIDYTVNGNRPDSELKSLKQYYEAQSYGAITLDITISEFYYSNTSYKYYSDYEQDKIYNAFELGTDAIEWYFATNTEESLDDYDLNSDGQVDGLILYYGSNFYGAEGDTNRSTAFEYSASIGGDYAFNTMVFCPLGGLYGLDRKQPTTQLTSNDLSETFNKSFRDSSRTIIHEMGHMFGNEDLYEDQLAEERYSPTGAFVMQDRNYGSHDPYHTNLIGWSKPQVYASSDYALGDKITLHLQDFQSTGQNIILTNTWNEYNSLYDEYLILELFAPVGLNEYDSQFTYFNIPTTGIRLWHVNSPLQDLSGGEITSQIVDGHLYELPNSNNDVTSTYDLLHLIRNNPDEPYNADSLSVLESSLFGVGDTFDMQTFKSQFINGDKLDNGEKLGWKFVVEEIYANADGTYGAIITLERTDNTRTEFSQTVTLNRSDLATPDGKEDYSDAIFGVDGLFTLTYQYVTPPSYYSQEYPISSDGMCLFASADGNGGYIQLTIKDIDGKQVCIDSITITYYSLTKATPTVLVGGTAVQGQQIDTQLNQAYAFSYEVGANSVTIQNQYAETIDYWSVLPLVEITINYTIE